MYLIRQAKLIHAVISGIQEVKPILYLKDYVINLSYLLLIKISAHKVSIKLWHLVYTGYNEKILFIIKQSGQSYWAFRKYAIF